ncbi:hypothetical protein [Oceanobacter mangrovi]|uniref:hypothetical protein n=1 Tax=Oceanobacter mangrovi TaxID=2862510 RepID=UPI001C8E13A9|nr:hypothetical protein [Oceanobacter mangrovi]
MPVFRLFFLMLVCSSVSAEISDSELTRYQTTIHCVDKVYYADGYSSDEAGDRTILLNKALAIANLPSYNSELEHRKLGQLDSKAYLAARDACESHWPEISQVAQSMGMHPAY